MTKIEDLTGRSRICKVGGSKTKKQPTYRTWECMKARCYSKRHPSYHNYGGRGIRVCDRWLNGDGEKSGSACFLADMGQRPTPTHTLDRIDNDKGYAPDNCRWATRQEQADNRSNVTMVTFQGRTMTSSAWSRELSKHGALVRGRLKLGWTVERAVTEPPRPSRSGLGRGRSTPQRIEEAVSRIVSGRRLGQTQVAIATSLGVSQSFVSKVLADNGFPKRTSPS